MGKVTAVSQTRIDQNPLSDWLGESRDGAGAGPRDSVGTHGRAASEGGPSKAAEAKSGVRPKPQEIRLRRNGTALGCSFCMGSDRIELRRGDALNQQIT